MNNKGFTLVEILAVVVILGMVMAIAIPNVSKLIKINEGNNYEQLKSTIMSAAKMYISDHKYEIVVNGSCSNPSDKISISKINTYDVIDDKLVISYYNAENESISENSEAEKVRIEYFDKDNYYDIDLKNKTYNYILYHSQYIANNKIVEK